MADNMVKFTATAPGFYEGKYIDPQDHNGGVFYAPESFTARWATRDNGKGQPVVAVPVEDLLAGTAGDIVAGLEGRTKAELNKLLTDERNGRNRTPVTAKIDDAIANYKEPEKRGRKASSGAALPPTHNNVDEQTGQPTTTESEPGKPADDLLK